MSLPDSSFDLVFSVDVVHHLTDRSGAFSFTAALVATLSSATAFAKDGDIEACAGLEEGEACTRADGDSGVCQPGGASAT